MWTRFPRNLFLVISINRFRSPIVIVLELVLGLWSSGERCLEHPDPIDNEDENENDDYAG